MIYYNIAKIILLIVITIYIFPMVLYAVNAIGTKEAWKNQSNAKVTSRFFMVVLIATVNIILDYLHVISSLIGQ